MSDRIRELLKGAGRNQRRILLWLGDQEGVTSPKDLRDRWPAEHEVREPALSSLLTQIQQSPVFAGRVTRTPTEYAPFLEDDYFLATGEPPEEEGWVRWRPHDVLGESPTNSQSSSLSVALRGLEERGLVELLKNRGKGYRVSHVRLTFEGEVASVLLQPRQAPPTVS